MKKIFAKITTGMLICILLASCKNEDVTMKVSPETFANVPSDITLTIINNTGNELTYGAHYVVEEQQGDQWVRMPFNDQLNFIELLYTQPAGETREHTISLYPEMANYKKGEYRIMKRINIGDKDINVYAGFVVE